MISCLGPDKYMCAAQDTCVDFAEGMKADS
jgi:hypothetical protein